jgi:hypothetical protein
LRATGRWNLRGYVSRLPDVWATIGPRSGKVSSIIRPVVMASGVQGWLT